MGVYALIWKHLRARPLRTALTVAAFSLSVGLLGFLMLVDKALREDFSPMTAQRIVVIPKTSLFDKLPIAYLSKIEAVPGIARVCTFDFVIAFKGDSRPENQVPVSAVTADPFLDVYREADLSAAQIADWKADPRGAVIGGDVADKWKWKPGERIVLKGPVRDGAFEFTVRAVMGYKLDNGVYIHRKYFEGLTGDDRQVAMFWALARTRDDVAPAAAALDRMFENAESPVSAMSEKAWQVSFLSMLGNVKALLGGIGLATAFALLLITTNTIAMSARERRSEAALLRILGFQRTTVAWLLVFEALAYGLLGAVFGSFLMRGFGALAGKGLQGTAMSGMGTLLVPTPSIVALCAVVSAVLALASGVVPALGISRRPIVQLLRETA